MFSLYTILCISISVLGTLPIKWYYSTVRPGCLTYCQSHLKVTLIASSTVSAI